jgi:MtrB/PioB family decaheme-associated outer membrane protein
MKHAKDFCFSRIVLTASIAAIGLSVPLARAAESANDVRSPTSPNSQIEVGIGHVSDESYKYGDYGRDMWQAGPNPYFNMQLNTRGENNASYLNLTGNNMGAETNWGVGLKTGEQGNYGLRFEYDQFSKLHSDSYQTPYSGMGTTRLTGPAGWAGTIDTSPGDGIINAPGATTVVQTQMMTALAASMKEFNVATKRVATGLGLTKQISGGWDVAVNFKHEDKDGTKLAGAPIQIGGGGSRGTLLVAEPIDYTTDLLDVVGRYAGETMQAQVGYHSSVFQNANRMLEFDNLYINPSSTVGGNGLTGHLGQMPGNQFHQVNASAGYAISKETRLTGSLSIGRMTQNEAFLPYTVAGANAGVLPATTSLNGKVDTTHADVKLTSKLTRELRLTAGFKYDDRDNKTPVNTYTYNTADNTNPTIGAGNTRTNTPLSKTQQALFADVDYELSESTRLKLGYDFDRITHTFEPTTGDKEHTIKAEVKHDFGDTASGGLAYAHSNRKADPYDGAAPLYSTYSAAYLASLCVAPNTFVYNGSVVACTGTASATSQATTPFLDTPALRKFFLTDRKRDKLRVFANMAPSETLDLQFGASYYKENYPEAEAGFGLAKATGWTANVDANWAATEAVSGVFFASVEDYKSDQNGHNGASNATANITTLDRQNNTAAFDPLTGTVNRGDRSLTMGLGFRFKPEDNYELGADFTRANATGSTAFSNLGSLLTTVLPVPDTVSRLNRLELFGKYHMQKDLTLNLKYAYERYESSDWAWDGQTYTSSTSFIGSGQTSPDYVVHVITASATYKF